eukprot:488575-Prorocentrum_lima.AAC.1
MTSSLVGSEMCIRDSRRFQSALARQGLVPTFNWPCAGLAARRRAGGSSTVSYTHLTLPTICSV